MSLIENLKAAKALIGTPEKWGKGLDCYFAKPGCRMCAHEALRQVEGDHSTMYRDRKALAAALPEAWQGYEVPEYNDHPDTTHADIMALFDRAITAAERSVASC